MSIAFFESLPKISQSFQSRKKSIMNPCIFEHQRWLNMTATPLCTISYDLWVGRTKAYGGSIRNFWWRGAWVHKNFWPSIPITPITLLFQIYLLYNIYMYTVLCACKLHYTNSYSVGILWSFFKKYKFPFSCQAEHNCIRAMTAVRTLSCCVIYIAQFQKLLVLRWKQKVRGNQSFGENIGQCFWNIRNYDLWLCQDLVKGSYTLFWV